MKNYNKNDMKIRVYNNDISKALRVLKKKLLAEGDMKTLREQEFHTPRGEKRRLAERAGRKRWLKKRQQIELRAQRKELEYLRKRKKPSNAPHKRK